MRLLRSILSIFVTGLFIAWLIAGVTVTIQDRAARRACFSAAGRVEHYDGDRPDVWRCVGARAEGE